jgi:hypothetical protein
MILAILPDTPAWYTKPEHSPGKWVFQGKLALPGMSKARILNVKNKATDTLPKHEQRSE